MERVFMCPKCGSLNVKQGEGYVICLDCRNTAPSFPDMPLSKVKGKVKKGTHLAPLEDGELERIGFFKKQKEISRKLLKFIQSPPKFFGENKDTPNQARGVLTFIIRLGIIVQVIAELVTGKFELFMLVPYVIFFILAGLLAMLSLIIGGFLINIFTSLFFKKSDSLLAERIIAYSSVSSLISPLSGMIGGIVSFILITIGISKQYRLSLWKSVVVAIMPYILLIGILLLILSLAVI